MTLDEVVTDTVVAAEYHRSHQTKHFFGAVVQGTIAIRQCICTIDTLQDAWLCLQYYGVHSLPVFIKGIQAVLHRHVLLRQLTECFLFI
jgi:hypothetical protein